MNTQHTPTPWYIHNGTIRGDSGDVIAETKMDHCKPGQDHTEENAANAALIVKAVNSHGALVEALRVVHAAFVPGLMKKRTVKQKWEALAMYRNALALAGE